MHLLVIIAVVVGASAVGAQVSDRLRAQPAPIPIRVTRPKTPRD